MLNRLDSKLIGGIMLTAGTSIGGAMLAMPITTGLFGFFGTLAILIACWLFMYWTATLILEASLCFEDGVSFFSMAKKTLGSLGAGVTWLTFLLLFYALVAAYLSGSGKIIIDVLENIIDIKLPPFFDILPLLIIFAPFIYFGLSVVDRINRLLIVGMFLSYGYIIFWLLYEMSSDRLLHFDWSFSLVSFSMVVTGFGYHVIIPSLVAYLERDIRRIKICLFYGSFIPLIVYMIWEMVMLGNLPVDGELGLFQAWKKDFPLSKLLSAHLHSDFLVGLTRLFSIFAVVTSFFGVAQGLFDFLQDRIQAKGNPHKRRLAFLLTFLPPIAIILLFEHGFIILLEYAGALVSIVLGIIPILIVWQLRKEKNNTIYRAPGNKLALIAGIAFFSFVVILVIFKEPLYSSLSM